MIRVDNGSIYDLGELKLNGQPYGYPTREMCREAIEKLQKGHLLALTGFLEPFETGREIAFQDQKEAIGREGKKNLR